MGGKALNRFGVFTERKGTEEFLRIGDEIHKQVAKDLLMQSHIVKCYHTKADHGDLDLLIKHTNNVTGINWGEYIQKTFKPQAINANGGVYSFDYQGFQVDFIPIPESKWETALVYFSYDPLGNIMGKTFHKFNLSYGWEGLFYKFRNFNGNNSADILITTDVKKIFEFGGYDYERYLKGFDTLEEIFKFCINSKCFDTEMFQMENLKSIDKKRNRKRGSYHLFLNYLKENNINTRYDFNKNKEDYIPIINACFPEANLLDKLNVLREEDRFNKLVSQKFNGDIVMLWLPELKGKELGAAIGKYKNSFSNSEEYKNFILNSDYENIRKQFMMIYNDGEDQQE